MRILVTGGAGFIGSHVVNMLVDKGCDVVVLDNLSTGALRNIDCHLKDGKVRFVEGDVRDFGLVDKSVQSVDAVVHLAAVTNVPYSVKDPTLTHDVNVTGTLNLLRACVKSDVDRFLYISSCAIYGEPEYLPIDERHSTNPISPYAASKLAAEYYCKTFQVAYGLKPVIMRLFNVYGPRQGANSYNGVIAEFLKNLRSGRPPIIYGDGMQTRDFVHVQDVIGAIWLCLNNGKVWGEAFNIGSGKATTLNGLAELLAKIVGKPLKPVYEESKSGDIKHSFADVGKAARVLGYESKIPLEKGLANFVEWIVICE